MSGNHLHWGDDFLGLLHDDFDIVAYDHRGIGHSDRVSAPFTIAGLVPDARLEILEGIGHAFWWERPERVAELLREHAAAAAAAQ
jgi:pimeloyl-ACP methyl ester carboxylesterase